jgi:hypothetical protein
MAAAAQDPELDKDELDIVSGASVDIGEVLSVRKF